MKFPAAVKINRTKVKDRGDEKGKKHDWCKCGYFTKLPKEFILDKCNMLDTKRKRVFVTFVNCEGKQLQLDREEIVRYGDKVHVVTFPEKSIISSRSTKKK